MEEKSVLFDDTTAISVKPMVSVKYLSKPIPADVIPNFIPDNRFLRVIVEADALYGSSMNAIIDSLIVELKEYKEDLGE